MRAISNSHTYNKRNKPLRTYHTRANRRRNLIVDIGLGYGGLDRILSYYIPNACFVLVDLPETLLLTSYVNYCLENIYRILRSKGYFYSLNKEYSDHLGIGFYSWNFKGSYLTKLMEYNNRFSYAQWLGEKIN